MLPAIDPTGLDELIVAINQLETRSHDCSEDIITGIFKQTAAALDALVLRKDDLFLFDQLHQRLCTLQYHSEDHRYRSLFERADKIKLAAQAKFNKTIALYAEPPRASSPFSVYHFFSNLLEWPGKLYSDYFSDATGPWKEVFDKDLEALKHALIEKGVDLSQCKQLLEQTVTPNLFEQKGIELLRLLLKEENPPLESGAARAGLIIDQLREILGMELFQYELNKIKAGEKAHYLAFLILDICYARYTEVQFYPFCETLIHTMVQAGLKQNENKDSFDLLNLSLEEQIRCISKAPQDLKGSKLSLFLKRMSGAISLYYDPQKTNIPWVLYDFLLTSQKQVRVLRCGTPTFQRINYPTMTWQGDAHIAPEFEHMIWKLDHVGQKLMFTSLQDDVKRWIGTEDTRNDALRKFVEKYPKAFFLLIFAQDSSFYHQSGEWEFLSKAVDFKEAFIKQLLGEKTGYYIPKEYRDNPFFHSVLRYLIDEVYHDLYLDKKELSQKERQAFIEFFHIRLALYFANELNIDFLLFCCKDSIDRAGKTNALLLFILLILMDKEKSEEHLRMMVVYIHAATVIVKQQEMNSRYLRLLGALEVLMNEEVAARIKKRKNDYGIGGDDIIMKKQSH